MSEKLSTWEILRNKFPPQEYVLIEEVSDASGFSRSRSLDFMLINLWNSRGLAITGIERKSNRGDWLNELKNPKKQENHFKYCDYFYLLTDKEGVAKEEEIPAAWGWYFIKGNSVKTMKAAPKLNPEPVNRSLLCAMLRRAASKDGFVRSESLQAEIDQRVEQEIAKRGHEGRLAISTLKQLEQNVEDFEKASGLEIQYGWKDPKKIGEAVKMFMNGGYDRQIENLLRLKTSTENILQAIQTNIETYEKVRK
jgi:hypothetical protein